MLDRQTFLGMVDHTLLAAETTRDQIIETAEYAAEIGAVSVCVNNRWTSLVDGIVAGTATRTCVVVGFPLGANGSPSKVQEARLAVDAGADELDVVWDLGGYLGGDDVAAGEELAAVRAAVPSERTLKVILETAAIPTDRLDDACRIALDAGADLLKTSTGLHVAGGATVESVTALAAAAGDGVGVKASGGIRTLADAEAMVAAGATRLGLSGTAAILRELTELTNRST